MGKRYGFRIPLPISLGYCKKDVTPLLTHWSYVFLALTHRYILCSSCHEKGSSGLLQQYGVVLNAMALAADSVHMVTRQETETMLSFIIWVLEIIYKLKVIYVTFAYWKHENIFISGQSFCSHLSGVCIMDICNDKMEGLRVV